MIPAAALFRFPEPQIGRCWLLGLWSAPAECSGDGAFARACHPLAPFPPKVCHSRNCAMAAAAMFYLRSSAFICGQKLVLSLRPMRSLRLTNSPPFALVLIRFHVRSSAVKMDLGRGMLKQN
jgi:hypothetical protein